MSYQPIIRNMVVNDDQDILTSKILDKFPKWKGDSYIQMSIIQTVNPVSLDNIVKEATLSPLILKEAFAFFLNYKIINIFTRRYCCPSICNGEWLFKR